ncbi:hypothetical protein EON83_28765 [bacterium]|nr:MAG: hypothetical protein EON83_28765 [bacterium]
MRSKAVVFHSIGLSLVSLCGLSAVTLADTAQLSIATVERMPRLPTPLAIRPWSSLSKTYYQRVLNPHAKGNQFPMVSIDAQKPGFRIRTYVGQDYDSEAFSALLAVVGSKLAGLDPTHLDGENYVQRSKAWYDPEIGLYRHRIGERNPVVHADIYGYWPAIQGLMLASQYPDDAEFQRQASTTFAAFQRIARGLGCPDNPNYDVLGWDFEKNMAAGRLEPMNRLGHAPSVAWVLMAGAAQTGDAEMLANARATMQWYAAHPGRYEISHVMGPLTAARLNVQQGGAEINMDSMMSAWFGEGSMERCPWGITSGTLLDGKSCDGLDAARWENNGFYAFSLGTLQGPAWLVPVARYDQRYARAIARYALNVANSARLLQGEGLDRTHQDHATWKARWDKDNILFYEGLASKGPGNANALTPYARGDAILNGWNTRHPRVPDDQYLQQREQWFGDTPFNIALYMGNSVGFLGGIMRDTNQPAILCWDCTATDWFHPTAYPTHLYYNPYGEAKSVRLELKQSCDLYDTVSGRIVARGAKNGFRLNLGPDEAAVIVQVPRDAQMERQGNQLLANGVVVDYRAQ